MSLARQFLRSLKLFSVHAPGATGRMIATDATTASIPSVWCVGRNYLEHIKELDNAPKDGSSPKAEAPMIFLKAGSSVLPSGQPLVLPRWSKDVHHEIELAVQLGTDLQPVRAAVSLDLTARDVQAKLKKAQHPWTLGKSFKGSTPLGPWFSLATTAGSTATAGGATAGGTLDLQDLELHLSVNGKTRQRDSTSKMLFKVDELIAYVIDKFPVVPGDVVLTGTPHGVSALADGDKVVAQILSNKGSVLSEGQWTVVSEASETR